MTTLASLNLIRLFDFYLAAMFVLGTWRRIEFSRGVSGLVLTLPGRWPHLFHLVKQHRTVFLTWSTLRPLALTLLLSVVHSLATRLVWPQANVDAGDLGRHWTSLLVVLPLGAAMLALDTYFLLYVATFDRAATEQQLDRAEFWLKDWKAPVVRFLSFGYVNPRRMVHEEVRKALVETSDLVNRSLWWTSAQVGLRIAFGLGLWLSWAFGT
jgi:hypothetical protein